MTYISCLYVEYMVYKVSFKNIGVWLVNGINFVKPVNLENCFRNTLTRFCISAITLCSDVKIECRQRHLKLDIPAFPTV